MRNATSEMMHQPLRGGWAAVLAFVAIAAALGGCANLEAVRTFSRASVPWLQTQALAREAAAEPDRWIDELGPGADEAARVAQAKARRPRLAAQARLVQSMQRSASGYMSALGALAGADAFSIGPALRDAGDGLVDAPELGIDASHVKAQAQLAAALADWAGRGLQARRIEDLVRQQGDAFEQVVQALASAADAMRRNAQDEDDRSRALLASRMAAWADPAAPGIDAAARPLVLQLARQAGADRHERAQARVQQARAVGAALARVLEGHRALRSGIAQVDAPALQALLMQAATDLRLLMRSAP